MNALIKLKEITENQKSVTTSRLAPLLKEVEMMYIRQGKILFKKKQQLKILQMESNRKEQFLGENQKRRERTNGN